MDSLYVFSSLSPTVGFATIKVMAPGVTAQLINTSDNSITLSEAVHAKASLAAFSLTPPECRLMSLPP